MRVAFFTDTFTEINGVALTSRQLTAYGQRNGLPFLCVRGSTETRQYQEGSVTHLELARGRFAFDLDKGLRHDPLLWRGHAHVAKVLREFKPDVIHIVSPGDVSEIGAYLAKKMKLPLAISWHTNLHEFGAMRLGKLIGWKRFIRLSESVILDAVITFYKMGDVLYAPNDELVEMLQQRTGKPVLLMKRGIDTNLYNPSHRTVHDGVLRLGYVGRITPEKSVGFLQKLEQGLMARGVPPFRFTIIGDGSEREWLQQNLRAADLPGILRGEALAEAYANMDIFVFPSRTDTFGNVVLEAFASGVPAVVTEAGGPKFIVRDGVSGCVANNEEAFIDHTVCLMRDAALRKQMSAAACTQAAGESWDGVFETVYRGYAIGQQRKQRASK